jgi:hypothetical protein
MAKDHRIQRQVPRQGGDGRKARDRRALPGPDERQAAGERTKMAGAEGAIVDL